MEDKKKKKNHTKKGIAKIGMAVISLATVILIGKKTTKQE